jgi:diguanylate cyclase (GGDEF)-like protein
MGVLALWVVRGEAISPTSVRYASGIAISAVALSLAVFLATRAGHFRMLAERAYLIELHQVTNHARHQVLRDHLSGLYSRWFFFERLAEELGRCGRYGRISSVAYLSFPAWSTLSLAIQAQLIEKVGYVLLNDLRTSDVAARWGPGRFVWYLPETDAAQAMAAGRRLAEAVKTAGAVVGAAQFPVDGSSPDELLRAAQARAEMAQAA